MINAKVITVRCDRNIFGIRLEEEPRKKGNWKMTWAFPISEKVAKSEKYLDETINGNFEFGTEYPGCPYCKASSFFQCSKCGTLNCWNGKDKKVTCRNCNTTTEIGGYISSLRGGNH